jgi:hypothetical protein
MRDLQDVHAKTKEKLRKTKNELADAVLNGFTLHTLPLSLIYLLNLRL